jgi:antagonist of KipI
MIEVLQPGLFTLVQDRGRWGAHARGIGPSGAADWFSAAVANQLVGNPAEAALLETALVGPTLRFLRNARVAITGAPCEVRIEHDQQPTQHITVGQRDGLRAWTVLADGRLTIGPAQRGCRTYIAIDGGIDTPQILGSRSVLRRAGLEGPTGRALRRGDHLPLGAPIATASVRDPRAVHAVLDELIPQADAVLRVLPGGELADAARATADALWRTRWRVSSRSDRMGVRLEEGAVPFAGHTTRASEPVTTGTIQLPPDGQPIILLNDRQTTGGYPVLGHVCTADLPRVAQLRPNTHVMLEPVTLDRARALHGDLVRLLAASMPA